ncbi:MAG TPA: Hsp33 family molecular chaperone HslO [Anaerovoracaceae bacterium]|nr:Hsp33 family molecular chaperone HslO [Anaerovoracaceae bacterium]
MNKALIAIDKSRSFRVYLAITTTMVEDARKVHMTTPLATAALGRALTGAGLMGLQLKNEQDKLTIQFKGDGPAAEILVTANGGGSVKGYISNPDVDLPLKENGKLDVGGAVGAGTLTVIKDLGLREPYVGKIDLVSGEIGEDLTAYFYLSEQQPASVALGVRINTDYTTLSAGGMIIQMLPEAKPESVDLLEKLLAEMPHISSLVEEVYGQAAGKTEEAVIDSLLDRIFRSLPGEFAMERLEYRDIKWDCDCSTERLEQVIISLGSKDLKEIIEEDEKAELVCQFCGTRYQFGREHLERLLEESMQREGNA